MPEFGPHSKVAVQTSPEPLGYVAAAARIYEHRGLAGLLWSGLPAKLLCNGVSSVVFSVAWKMLMDRQADRSRHAPRHTKDDDDDGEGGAPLLAGDSRV